MEGSWGTGEVENENNQRILTMIPHNSGFVWILEMTLLGGRLEAARTLQRVPGRTGEVENEKKNTKFDGLVETMPMIPHVAGLDREMILPEIQGGFPKNFRDPGLPRPFWTA